MRSESVFIRPINLILTIRIASHYMNAGDHSALTPIHASEFLNEIIIEGIKLKLRWIYSSVGIKLLLYILGGIRSEPSPRAYERQSNGDRRTKQVHAWRVLFSLSALHTVILHTPYALKEQID